MKIQTPKIYLQLKSTFHKTNREILNLLKTQVSGRHYNHKIVFDFGMNSRAEKSPIVISAIQKLLQKILICLKIALATKNYWPITFAKKRP